MNYGFTTAQSLFQQAVQAFQTGKLAEAEMLCQRCQQQFPTFSESFHMQGVICGQSNRLDQGITLMTRANALDPRNAAVLANLGELFRRSKRYPEAAKAFQAAINLQPQLTTAWVNLGLTHVNAGRPGEAVPIFRQLVKNDPNNATYRFNLGNALHEYGLVAEALPQLQAAVELKPDYADAWINLGNSYQALDRLSDAIDAFEKALHFKPHEHALHESISIARLNLGQASQSRDLLAAAGVHRKSPWLWQLRAKEIFEPVAPDQSSVDQYQEELLATLESLTRSVDSLTHDELIVSGVCPSMLLTYQQGRERQIREAYVKLFSPFLKPIAPAAPARAVPEIGIVVTHGHEGVFLKCFEGILNRSTGQKVKCTLISSTIAGSNILRTSLKNPNLTGITVVAKDIRDFAARIAERHFDALHYFEVGTDSTNYFLPFLQPAPVQIASWGWPSSTRIPGVGWYQSSSLLETPESLADYSEKVFTPNCLPVCYATPPDPAGITRQALGLPEGRVYFCAQNLRKYQPRFDQALKQILAQDPTGQLVLLADAQPTITNLLLARLTRSGLPMDRVTIAPRADYKHFIARLHHATVALDTFGYGGGANTVLDTLFSTTPQITFPEPHHHRTRWASAALTHAGISHGIAHTPEDYAAQAVKIATDTDLNNHLRAQALAARDRLFNQTDALDTLENWWLQITRP